MPASKLINILFCLLVLFSLVLIRNFVGLRVALIAFLICFVCSVILSCAASAVVKVCIIRTSWSVGVLIDCNPLPSLWLVFVLLTLFFPFWGFESSLLMLAQEMSVFVQKPFSLLLLWPSPSPST